MRRRLSILVLSGLAATAVTQEPQGGLIPLGIQLDCAFFGTKMDTSTVKPLITHGSSEIHKAATKAGASYSVDSSGGLNWAKLKSTIEASRLAAEDAITFNCSTRRRVRDRLKIRSRNFRNKKLRLYLRMLIQGDLKSEIIERQLITQGNDTANSLSHFEAFLIASNGASGAPYSYGTLQNNNGTESYFGQQPGLIESGAIQCTEGVTFDLMADFLVNTSAYTGSKLGFIGRASADFSHTFRNAGVRVTDELGNAISNFTIISELGIDWTKTANPAVLKSLSLSQSTVVGGTTISGTVALDHRAEQGGQTVLLKSRSVLATVQAQKVVPYLSTSAVFPIETSVVGSTQTADIVARMEEVTKVKTLTITPAPPLVLAL